MIAYDRQRAPADVDSAEVEALRALIAELAKPREERSILIGTKIHTDFGDTLLGSAAFFALSCIESSSEQVSTFASRLLVEELERSSEGGPDHPRALYDRFEKAIDQFLATDCDGENARFFSFWCRAIAAQIREGIGDIRFCETLESAISFISPGMRVHHDCDYRTLTRSRWLESYCVPLREAFEAALVQVPSERLLRDSATGHELMAITGAFGEPEWMVREAKAARHELCQGRFSSGIDQLGGTIFLLKSAFAAKAPREELDRLAGSLFAALGDIYQHSPSKFDYDTVFSPISDVAFPFHFIMERLSDEWVEKAGMLVEILASRYMRLRAALLDEGSDHMPAFVSVQEAVFSNSIPCSYERGLVRSPTPHETELVSKIWRRFDEIREQEQMLARELETSIIPVRINGAFGVESSLYERLVAIQNLRLYSGDGRGLRQVYSADVLESYMNAPGGTLFMLVKNWECIGFICLSTDESSFPGYMKKYLFETRERCMLLGRCGFVSLFVTEPAAAALCANEGKNSLTELYGAMRTCCQGLNLDWIYGWCWDGNRAAIGFEKAGAEILEDLIPVDDEGVPMTARMMRVRVFTSPLYDEHKPRRAHGKR